MRIGIERSDLASRRLDLEPATIRSSGFLTFADVAEIETTLDGVDARHLPMGTSRSSSTAVHSRSTLFAIGEPAGPHRSSWFGQAGTGDLIESIEVSVGRDRSVSVDSPSMHRRPGIGSGWVSSVPTVVLACDATARWVRIVQP
ncbi:MAG: hypothetical protein R2710_12700 [Acidimicrobiales bacterium]